MNLVDIELVAKAMSNGPYDVELKELEFKKLPLAEDWMPWAIYTSDENSPRILALKESISLYNAAVRAIKETSGLYDEWVKNGLSLSRAVISEKWGTEIAQIVFSVKEAIFTPQFKIINDTLVGVPAKATEYEVHVPNMGLIKFSIEDATTISYEYVNNKRYELAWDYSCDDRDLTFSIWEMLDCILPDAYDEDGNETGIPGFPDYECWSQGRGCMSTPDKRLLKCISLLIEYGYAWRYRVVPEKEDPSWYITDRGNPSLGILVVDTRFKKDKLMMEKLKLVLSSIDFYEGKKQFFLVGKDNQLYLSSTPAAYGGHRKLMIYGRLDCPSAARYIEKGQYIQHRVFFENIEIAKAAGYRPCGICMPEAYKEWKAENKD